MVVVTKVSYPGESEECYYYIHENQTNQAGPVLLWIESAPFLTSELPQFEGFAQQLSGRGLNVIRIKYRLNRFSSDIKHPAHLTDCLKAYLHILTQSKFRNNPIYIGGHSVGAFLSLLIALDATTYLTLILNDVNLGLSLISKIKGIINVAGTFDLSDIAKYNSYFYNNVGPAFISQINTNQANIQNQNVLYFPINNNTVNLNEYYTNYSKQRISMEDEININTSGYPLNDSISKISIKNKNDLNHPNLPLNYLSNSKVQWGSPMNYNSMDYNRMDLSNPNGNNVKAPYSLNANVLDQLLLISPQSVSLDRLQKIPYPTLPKVLLIHSLEDVYIKINHTLNFVTHLKSLGFTNINVLINYFDEHNDVHNHFDVINNIFHFVNSDQNSINYFKPKL